MISYYTFSFEHYYDSDTNKKKENPMLAWPERLE